MYYNNKLIGSQNADKSWNLTNEIYSDENLPNVTVESYKNVSTNPVFDTRSLQGQNYSSDSRMIEENKIAAEQVKKQKEKENFAKLL